jgi:16S rRNA (guanine966-N2)-methyltransferase
MRVIGGKYRNRRIHPPAGTEARPTTDYAKEGLFNVLRNQVPLVGIRVLDLFAGTGSMSLEFLSQGADEVISVESDRRLHEFMGNLARELGEEHWHRVRSDAFAYLRAARGPFDLIFADPPFAMEGIERLPTLVREMKLLDPEGLLILEHPATVSLDHLPGFNEQRGYGLVQFSFFGPDNEPPRA